MSQGENAYLVLRGVFHVTHTRKATITFTDNVKGEDVTADMGDRGIMISGGTLSLHGDQKNARTKLSATANAGATSIQVLSAASTCTSARSHSMWTSVAKRVCSHTEEMRH